jgi:hypothetical protein
MKTEFQDKYRPKTFDEYLGNERTKKAILSKLNAGTLPHAILLYGPIKEISMESELNEKPDGKAKVFFIQPYGTRYYALYEGGNLVCVTLEMVSNVAPKEE